MFQKIAFCHIPKTAGTTISRYLRSNYAPSDIFPADRVDNVNQRMIDEINDYSLISGHFPLSFLKSFLSDEWKIITALREPIDRFNSQLLFDRSLVGGSSEVLPEMTAEALESYGKAFGNYQTQYLGATLSENEWRYLVASRKISVFHLVKQWNSSLDDSCQAAMAEIPKLAYVLDTTQLEGGLHHLAITCDLWPFAELPVSNKGAYSELITNIDSGFENFALTSNLYDSRLFKFSRQYFAINPSLESFSKYQKKWIQKYKTKKSYFAAPDFSFYSMGWHLPEYSSDGNAFCWSDGGLEQIIYIPISYVGYYEIEISLYLPNQKPGFTCSIEYEGHTCSATLITATSDLAHVIFRPKKRFSNLDRLYKLKLHTNCEPQVKASNELREVGYIFSGIMVRFLSNGKTP